MSTLLYDRDQRLNAIEPRLSVVVRAPAGSGKTFLLLERLLHVLLVVDKPEQCLLLTFTNKAVQELKDRFFILMTDPPESLEELCAKVRTRSVQMGWGLTEQMHQLPIMTIDSFFLKIYKKFSPNSYAQSDNIVDPEFLATELIDRFFHFYLIEQVDDDLLNLACAFDHHYINLKSLLNALYRQRELWIWQLIKDELDPLSGWDQLFIKELHVLNVAVADHQEKIKEFFSFMNMYDPSWEHSVSLPLRVHEWKKFSQVLITQNAQWRKTLRVSDGFPNKANLLPWHTQEDREEQLDTIAQVQLALKDLSHSLCILELIRAIPMTKENQEYSQSLIQVLKKLLAFASVEQSELGLDYADISLAVTQLFFSNTSTELQVYIERDIFHVFIDEVQDLSAQQWKVFECIFKHFAYESKSFFLVGDPTQAIYHFRGAQVGIFSALEEASFEGISKKNLSLSCNFRSSSVIVEFVNRWGAQTFGSSSLPVLGVDKSHKAYAQLSEKGYIDCFEFSTIQQEAYQLALFVKQALGNETEKNIAILARDRKSLLPIQEALDHLNVRFDGPGLKKILDFPICLDIVHLTQVLLFPDDKKLWLAALNSCFFHATSSDNLTFYHHQNLFFEDLKSDCYSDSFILSYKRISQLVRQWRVFKSRSPLIFYIKSFFRALDVDRILHQDQIQLFDLVMKSLQHYSWNQLPTYRLWLRKLEKLYSPIRTNARLSLITVHQAKGLEFDIVLLPQLGARLPVIDSALLYTLDAGLYSVWAPKPAYGTSNQLYDCLKLINSFHQDFEASRLLYVALTRAKKSLILSMNQESSHKRSFKELLIPFIQEQIQQKADVDILDAEKKIREYYPLSNKLPTEYPSDWIWNESPIQSVPALWQHYEAKIVGLVVHDILSKTKVFPIEKYRLSKEAIFSLYKRFGGLDEQFSSSLNKIGSCIVQLQRSQDICAFFKNTHKAIYMEWKFSYIEKNKLKQSVVDRLIFTEEGKWIIIEFKSTSFHGVSTLKHQSYLKQVKSYHQLLARIKKEPIQSFLIYISDPTIIEVLSS